jgi:hypothetical protein
MVAAGRGYVSRAADILALLAPIERGRPWCETQQPRVELVVVSHNAPGSA